MTVLERERSLADLSQWLGAAGQGEGCIVLIAGEAGIGKTTLIQAFSSVQRNARVLWGACDALFTPRPLAPLHDIARQAQGFLSAALNSGASRDIVFSAMLDELEGEPTLVGSRTSIGLTTRHSTCSSTLAGAFIERARCSSRPIVTTR